MKHKCEKNSRKTLQKYFLTLYHIYPLSLPYKTKQEVMMNYKLNIELIKLQMIQKGYSINSLSKESHISKSTISRLLNQLGTSRPETIYKIAQALDLQVKDLLL